LGVHIERRQALEPIVGEKVIISKLDVFFHKREPGEEKASLIEEVAIPFRS